MKKETLVMILVRKYLQWYNMLSEKYSIQHNLKYVSLFTKVYFLYKPLQLFLASE